MHGLHVVNSQDEVEFNVECAKVDLLGDDFAPLEIIRIVRRHVYHDFRNRKEGGDRTYPWLAPGTDERRCPVHSHQPEMTNRLQANPLKTAGRTRSSQGLGRSRIQLLMFRQCLHHFMGRVAIVDSLRFSRPPRGW